MENAVDISKIQNQYDSSDVPTNFLDYLQEYAPVLQPYIEAYLKDARTNWEQKKHKDVDKYLYDPLAAYASNAGKLHRPLTCLAAFKACGGNNLNKVLPFACAIEIFQAAALIHDDIADGADMRRGKPCMHKTQGTGLSINAGDFGLTMVLGMCFQQYEFDRVPLDSSQFMQVVNELLRMEYMTIEGQAMDLGWARDGRYDIDADDYLTMAAKKSAYYSAAIPCVIGGICASANSAVQEALDKFGYYVGLAFQIQDDIINLVGNDMAKDFRSDITEGKRTLIVVHALENSSQEDHDKLVNILQSQSVLSEDLAVAVRIMQEAGSIDFAKNLAGQFIEKAVKHLEGALPDSEWKDLLNDMAVWAGSRDN